MIFSGQTQACPAYALVDTACLCPCPMLPRSIWPHYCGAITYLIYSATEQVLLSWPQTKLAEATQLPAGLEYRVSTQSSVKQLKSTAQLNDAFRNQFKLHMT